MIAVPRLRIRLRWQLLAFLLGILFFFIILRNFGFSSVGSVLARAGGASFLVFFFYPLMSLWDAMSWKFCFSREFWPQIRFFRLYFIRLTGEAFNNVTPFMDIGGEPLKVFWTHHYFGIPKSAAASATVVARTSLLVSEALFMLLGVLLSLKFMPLESKYRMELFVVLLAACSLFIAFLVVQQKGLFKKINPEIAIYHLTHRQEFWTAVLLNGAGWIAGGLEMYFFCRLLHLEISVLNAVMLEGLLRLVRTASFSIPGNLGAQEGGLAFLMAQMGYEPVLGVGLSLLKRFRQILWTGIGFLCWLLHQHQEVKKKKA